MKYNNLSIDELHKFLKNVNGALDRLESGSISVLEIRIFGVDFEIKDVKTIDEILDLIGGKIMVDLHAYHDSVSIY
jgi:hypothetical protein